MNRLHFRGMCILLVSVSFLISGCGGGLVEEKVAVPTNAIEANVRKTLESFEKTGQTGSALTSLESDINGIKSTDPAKGEELTKGYRELQQLSDPKDIKAKAKEMLGKL